MLSQPANRQATFSLFTLFVLGGLLFFVGAALLVGSVIAEENGPARNGANQNRANQNDTNAKSSAATKEGAAGEVNEQGKQLFDDYVASILERNCYQCHSHAAGEAEGGLVLDSSAGLLTGGETGPAVVPGDPDASILLSAVTHENDDLQMPPDGPLAAGDVAKLRQWIEHGAPHSGTVSQQTKAALRAPLWSIVKLGNAKVPSVTNTVWPLSDIDRFIIARQESAGISPVGDADRTTLLRRVHLTLTGLPPTIEEMAAFESDKRSTAEATAALVDRLLASPDYGERWARHWLDIARYADTNGAGSEANNTIDNAWRYRDYVIAAFNDDKPFDRFVIEQLAGEQLPYSSVEQRRSQIIATGFLQMGPKPFGEQSLEKFRLDVIDEQIDTVGKSLLGMSFGCGRCHDHKFDPFTTVDYYALAGIFSSTRTLKIDGTWRMSKAWIRVPLPFDEAMAEVLKSNHKARVELLNNEYKAAQEVKKKADEQLAAMKAKLDVTADEIAAAEAEVEKAKEAQTAAKARWRVSRIDSVVPSAIAVEDKPAMVSEPVRLRGLPNSRGKKKIPRGMPSLLGAQGLDVTTTDGGQESTPVTVESKDPFAVPTKLSGRLQLARWLVDTERGAGNLTARVIVNRIWRHVMGEGLVDTPDNFGRTGSAPSHPALLDHLAQEFIADGWSIKRLVRRLMLTRTFALASTNRETAAAVDPENRLLWRYNVRRLDVEVIRDSMLAVSGELDRKRGGPTLQIQGTISLNDEWVKVDREDPFFRRTVYLPLMRDEFERDEQTSKMLGMLPLFDAANPSMVVGRRSSTTVPSQSLYLLNSDFVIERSVAAADRLLADETLTNDVARIDRLIRWAYGRAPTDEELKMFLESVPILDDAAVASGIQAPQDRRSAIYTEIAQVLFSTTEFLTVK